MVKHLNFPDLESAKKVRDEYFTKYHSTAKALTVAEEEGKFPTPSSPQEGPLFDPKDLATFWASQLNFELLGKPDQKLIDMLKDCPLQLVAFSNGPRKYVQRVLVELGLNEIFTDDKLFAVDDVLPHCKPEKAAFDIVLEKVNAKADECIMVEDSMKNIRAAKALGMKTILVAGKGRQSNNNLDSATKAAEATKIGDAPDTSDIAVDVCVEVCSQIRDALPHLWEQKN